MAELPPDIREKMKRIDEIMMTAETELLTLKNIVREVLKKAISDDPVTRTEAYDRIDEIRNITTRLFMNYITRNINKPKTEMMIDFILFRVKEGLRGTTTKTIIIKPTDIQIQSIWGSTSILKQPSITILLTLIYYADKLHEEIKKLDRAEEIIKERLRIRKLIDILEEKVRKSLEPLGVDVDKILNPPQNPL